LSVVQNRIPREQHAGVLDRILRDVPTLADIWVLRAGYHIEAAEWDLADGSLAVARLLNPAEPSLERMETRLDARRPALDQRADHPPAFCPDLGGGRSVDG
jgi:hypothetical protein